MKLTEEFNSYGTNIHIKPHIQPDEIMEQYGFKKPNNAESWLYVESVFGSNASLWIEIWGDNISIEMLDDDKVIPYAGSKRSVASKFMKRKLSAIQKAGIISGYNPKEIVWRDIYLMEE